MNIRNIAASLGVNFRSSYVGYEAICKVLRAWCTAMPDCTELVSLGRTAQGRDLCLLKIGKDLATPQPAAWINGNMHAAEVAGSSVALQIAEDILALHSGAAFPQLLSAQREALLRVHFYIVPRVVPDGSEEVLATGRYLRSSGQIDRTEHRHAYWRFADVDGDGKVRMMRQLADNGEMTALPGYPHVLVPREPSDQGPHYRVFAEGTIENFDGYHIPDPDYLGYTHYDYNRNFPWSWVSTSEQAGSGAFPGSAPETRAIMEFAQAHANIFLWLDLHTFGGFGLRPLSHRGDDAMHPGDLAIYDLVGKWLKEHTDYPLLSTYQHFVTDKSKPLHGLMIDYAYHQRGALAYLIELWDLPRRLGIKDQNPMAKTYQCFDREHYLALLRFDQEVNENRIFQPYRPFYHPQLGAVEIGGPDLLVGITNPPYSLLGELCERQSLAFLHAAQLLPQLSLSVLRQQTLGNGETLVTIKVMNHGYLGSAGLPSHKDKAHVEPMRVAVHGENIEWRNREAVAEGFHVDGWGRGLHQFLPFFAWSRGNSNERVVNLLLSGQGRVSIEVSSCRSGSVKTELELA